MASLACSISSLKPQFINPSSHKLLGFNYLSNQLTLKLSPTHQPFYSTTRPSKNFTTKAATAGTRGPNYRPRDNSSNQLNKNIVNTPSEEYKIVNTPSEEDKNIVNTSSEEDKIVNTPCVYAIKLEEPGKVKQLLQGLFNSKKKKHVSFNTGVCMLRPKEKNDALYNFHFGEHDYVSVRGQCLNSEDTYLNVIGGSGIFKGVQGKVKLQKICIEAPVKLLYTFHLEGIENLPDKL